MRKISSFISGVAFSCLLLVCASFLFAALTPTATVNPIKVIASADDDEGTITLNEVDVAWVQYCRYDAIGDECIIQDTAGNVVFDFGTATVAGMTMVSPRIDQKYTGLKIPTNSMDSGTLYIYRND